MCQESGSYQRGIVDFNYIVAVLKEIKEKQVKECVEKKERGTRKVEKPFHIKVALALKFPKFILNKLSLQRKPESRNFLVVNDDMKRFSLDFLLYCLEKREKLHFDLSLFECEKDRKEILKFVRNKLYLAIFDNVHKNKLFDENDLKYMQKYKEFFMNKQKKANNYVLKAKNKEYVLPADFRMIDAICGFYHKYGTEILPSQIKQNLINRDFIDAGAYIGDSALILNELKPNKIYAFEPSKNECDRMQEMMKLNKNSNVVVVQSGLGSKEGVLNFFGGGMGGFITDKGSEKVKVTTIDSFVEKNSLNLGLIKMDIEGYELEAIKGAEKTIKEHKPVLIICLYHSGKDFFEIPNIIKQWDRSYKFRFLNLNHSHPIVDRVLVAY